MGHLGLTPQSATMLGGFKAQGRSGGEGAARSSPTRARSRRRAASRSSSRRFPHPSPHASRASSSIPTIGIGAGPDCDGQVLVWHDLLGLYEGRAGALRQALRRVGRRRSERRSRSTRRRARAPLSRGAAHVRDARGGARALRAARSALEIVTNTPTIAPSSATARRARRRATAASSSRARRARRRARSASDQAANAELERRAGRAPPRPRRRRPPRNVSPP